MFKNFAKATLAAGISSTATSVTLLSGHGDRLDAAAFVACIWRDDLGDQADAYWAGEAELVLVAAGSGDSRNITRGQGGTTARNLNTAGKTYRIAAVIDADLLNNLGTVVNPDNSQRRRLGVYGTGADETVGFEPVS